MGHSNTKRIRRGRGTVKETEKSTGRKADECAVLKPSEKKCFKHERLTVRDCEDEDED